MINDCTIQMRKLNLYFGSFHALKDVDFCVFKNKITVLIGPSRFSKSTLLRCFNKMQELYDDVKITGNIDIFGKDIMTFDIILIVTHNMQQTARVSAYTGFMLLRELIEFGEMS